MSGDNWPQHPDGRPKRFGDLTREEQRAVLEASAKRLKRELESPEMVAAIKRALD